MREILFRGKRADNGEWVEGYYAALTNSHTQKVSHVIFYATTVDHIDPETIGEYTGLRDKNGKRIFEGDIVREKDIIHKGEIQIKGKTYEVKMRKGCWMFVNRDDWDFLRTNASDIEIIGNVHDTPELLNE